MPWMVLEHPEFVAERAGLPLAVQEKLAEMIIVLEQAGPGLGRPHADTLGGSRFRNMKELRLGTGGAWRFAFAFDEERQAIILIGADKRGVAQSKFYETLIRTADRRFGDWLRRRR